MKLPVFSFRIYELFDETFLPNAVIPYSVQLYILFQTPQVMLFKAGKRYFVISTADLSKSDLLYLLSKTKEGVH